MKIWSVCFTIILTLLLSSCQFLGETDPEREKEIQEEEDPSESEGRPKSMERIVTLGLEDYEEKYTFIQYHNEWIKMWYDPQLTIDEENQSINFYGSVHELAFYVKLIDNQAAYPLQEIHDAHNNILALGYELITDFQLDTRDGTGYIYYSPVNKQSIEVYLLDEEDHSILVQFSIPEEAFEDYMPRFEFMMESIELLS